MRRPPRHTFLIGEVGVVTWLVGLAGEVTAMLAGVGVVLLLTEAEGLLLSGEVKRSNKGVRVVEANKEAQPFHNNFTV